MIEDADCDTVRTEDDCDDNSASAGAIADDTDCDGALNTEDCDDTDPSIFPGAAEIIDDGIDQDCNGHDAVTCTGDRTYETAENCGAIVGSLTISGSTLEALDHLKDLRTVSGRVDIQGNDYLTTLTGLERLESVGTVLNLWGNDALMTLEGMGALTAVGAQFSIWVHDSLISLEGLDSLESVGGTLDIQYNDELCNSIIEEFVERLEAREGAGGITIIGNADC
jgi:hypothetical protein